MSEEEVLVAEAQVVASRLVEWFRERLLTADAARDAAVEARVAAEDDRRVADAQRVETELRVIEVERLLAASEELAERLQQALESRIIIEQAKGILAHQYAVTPAAAFDNMRRYARARRLGLHELAQDVVDGVAHDIQMHD